MATEVQPLPPLSPHRQQVEQLQLRDTAAQVCHLPAPTQQPQSVRLPVHQRHTASSRMQATVDPQSQSAAFIRALLHDARPSASGGSTLPPLAAAPGRASEYVRRGGGEAVRELVAKKRQIFLAQMSLDTKHSEIAKLEERAHQREEALLASEQALEQDSQRFEEYLKENDAKLQEALRAAEAAAKARADKAADAKRLAVAIAGIRSEMGKLEEHLQECQRHKAFLDSVTPEEWFESLAAERAAKKAALRQDWEAACGAIERQRQEAAAARQRAEHDMQWARTQQQYEQAERAHREAGVALKEAQAQQAPPEPDYSVVDAEEEAMHFHDPAQLLAVFSQLEGSNMFQIQAAQDAEAELEAAHAAHAATSGSLDAQAGALRRQVAELEAAIAAAQGRCEQLQAAAQHNLEGGIIVEGSGSSSAGACTSSGKQQQQGAGGVSLVALAEQLGVAYEAAGFARDASVTPLQMLQKVEAQLEECLAAIGPAGSPAAIAAEAVERAREKERRQAARADKLAAQQAEHDARIQRVLQRAAAPKFQRSGKPAMIRSVLQREDAAAGAIQDEDAEEELQAYLALIDASIQ